MERLSPVGADAKSLRREAKRGYELAVAASSHMIKIESMESPTKKPMLQDKSKLKANKSSTAAASSAAAKKKAVRHQQVAELQDAVVGIQQQVDAASKGIQELKQLVHSHLLNCPSIPEPDSCAGATACVSPPASLMTMDQDEGCVFDEFPGHPDALMYYGGGPMPFSC